MENVLGVISGNGKSQGNTGVFTLFCIDHKLCFAVIEDLHPAVKVCKTNATVLAGGFLGKAVNDIKAGKIEYRLDKTNIIHVPVGKASFTSEQLNDNFQSLMGAINKAKPSSLKGQYIKSAVLTSTMGPGVKLNVVKIAQ